MRRRIQFEEEVNKDRWLVSYADLLTLLLSVFAVLFASAYRDKMSVQRVSYAVRSGFRDMGSFAQSKRDNSSTDSLPKGVFVKGAADSGGVSAPSLHDQPRIDAGELQKQLNKTLGQEIERREVVMSETPEGFVISLRELGFFNSGEAQLLPGAADKLSRIAALLNQYGLSMRVEGHTDNVPIHNASFTSNWDLSIARATSVAMMLIDHFGFDPRRISVAGYGEFHPVAANDTADGRKQNRRVDIVVLSVVTPPGANPR